MTGLVVHTKDINFYNDETNGFPETIIPQLSNGKIYIESESNVVEFDFKNCFKVDKLGSNHLNSVNNVLINGQNYLHEDGKFMDCLEAGLPNQSVGWIKSWCGLGIKIVNDSSVARVTQDFGL